MLKLQNTGLIPLGLLLLVPGCDWFGKPDPMPTPLPSPSPRPSAAPSPSPSPSPSAVPLRITSCSANPPTGTAPLDTRIDMATEGGTGTKTWRCQFGDGQTRSSSDPFVRNTYSTPGTYFPQCSVSTPTQAAVSCPTAPQVTVSASAPAPAPGPPQAPDRIALEAENGSGGGSNKPRSNASGQQTAWLHAGETRRLSFSIQVGARYTISVRYSNDQTAGSPSETVSVTVDGSGFSYQAESTGVGDGNGWNVFKSANLGTIDLTSGGHTVEITPSGGDGFGIEIDVVVLQRQ